MPQTMLIVVPMDGARSMLVVDGRGQWSWSEGGGVTWQGARRREGGGGGAVGGGGGGAVRPVPCPGGEGRSPLMGRKRAGPGAPGGGGRGPPPPPPPRAPS